jgi:hypothetical protein
MDTELKRKSDQIEAEEAKRREEAELDKALGDSFPASDPISTVQPRPSPDQDKKPKDKSRRSRH